MYYKIESYWFGFVVCTRGGHAVSQAFKTENQAIKYREKLENAKRV